MEKSKEEIFKELEKQKWESTLATFESMYKMIDLLKSWIDELNSKVDLVQKDITIIKEQIKGPKGVASRIKESKPGKDGLKE